MDHMYCAIYDTVTTSLHANLLLADFDGCPMWSRYCIPFRNTCVHPRFV